jgi:hypothetical protein
MFRYYKNINIVIASFRNSGSAFIANKGWLKITIAFGLTLVILAGLCFSTSSVTAGSINKASSPGYYYDPGFGYGSTTTIFPATSPTTVTTSEPTSKFTFPWWGWTIIGISFLITVLVMWRRDSNKR